MSTDHSNDGGSSPDPQGSLGACCPTTSVNALDTQFGEGYARNELKAYRKEGLGARARLLVDFLCGQGLMRQSILEIGCGIGALHLELLLQGAAHAVGVDASSANIETARSLAQEMGLADLADERIGDFTSIQEDIPKADVVLLDRVVCCYPHMDALVGATAGHALHYVGLTYPRRAWWMRWSFRLFGLFLAIKRNPYRAYYHDPDKIDATVVAQGLTPVFQATAGPWDVVVFQRTT